MPKYVLHYFGVKGRGEAIRLLLTDQGADFEDKRMKGEEWPELKKTMQFGQLPCLHDGEFKLVQSSAILRYLGKQLNIAGKDNKEAAEIDMLHDHVQDIREQYTIMIYTDYEAGKDKFVDGLPGKLQPLEKQLEGKQYLIGDKICWADYNFFDVLNALLKLSPTCLGEFPGLQAYHERVQARPGIRKRTDSDDYQQIPINANGKC